MKFRSYFYMSISLLGSLAMVGCKNESNEAQTATQAVTQTDDQTTQIDTILAIFAHPDDEISAAPLLAKYAREGKTVYLASVTDGRWGGATNDEEAAELAVTRALETQCSTTELGIEAPILLDFEDGEVSDNVYAVKATIAGLFASIEPDVVITWGPEGGYGHKDHRLVSTIVSDVFQAGSIDDSAWPEGVYYPGIPEFQLNGFGPVSGFGATLQAIWGTTKEDYLQYTIEVDDEDIAAAKLAAACHISQWDETTLVDIGALIDAGNSAVYLRKAHHIGTAKTSLD